VQWARFDNATGVSNAVGTASESAAMTATAHFRRAAGRWTLVGLQRLP
jgi:hypothetical protein